MGKYSIDRFASLKGGPLMGLLWLSMIYAGQCRAIWLWVCVPKACPNEVARAVFWWLVVARTGRSEGIPIA